MNSTHATVSLIKRYSRSGCLNRLILTDTIAVLHSFVRAFAIGESFHDCLLLVRRHVLPESIMDCVV